MNRLEYLTQLRRLLEDGGLAEDEINDAMGFYEEIFLLKASCYHHHKPNMVQPYVCLCRNSPGDTLRAFKHNNCSFRNRLLPYNRRYSNAFHGLSRRHCPDRCRTYLYRTWRHDCNACYKVHMAWLCKPFQQIHKLCP